jgi:hypothetical protein
MITKGAAMFIIRRGQRIEVADNYVLKSGESLALPLSFMDSATREQRRSVGLTDANIFDAYGIPSGHRPGYVFTVDASIRQRAADAYEERNKWLESAHRHVHDHEQDLDADERPPPLPRSCTLADAQAAAERAYADKIEWLKNASRNRDAA